MEEKEKFASTWNASQLIIMELMRLKTLANQNYAINRVDAAIQNLIAAKQTIIAALSSEERKDLRSIEKEFFACVLIMKQEKIGFVASPKYWPKYVEQFKIYDRYNEKLMIAMQSHDLLLGEKVDVSKYKG